MTRKKFLKQLQAAGVQRNAAKVIARDAIPGGPYGPFLCGFLGPNKKLDFHLTNAVRRKDGTYFRVKYAAGGGGHE